jgi:diguanylate cyclase (GGDEF)-like protein
MERLGGSRAWLLGRRPMLILNGLVLSIIGVIAGLAIWHSRSSALDDHRRDMHSMGVVLAEQTSRYVQVVDLILHGVQAEIASRNIADLAEFHRQLSTPLFQASLAERLNHVPQADAVALIDADGKIANWSRPEKAPGTSVADRDYYQYFKEHNDPDLFIGSLAKARITGKLGLFFGRRLNGANGQFLGVILCIVDVKYLSEFYRAAGEHRKESVTVMRRDGTMLMQYPNPEAALGVGMPHGSPWYGYVAEGGGSYVAPFGVDGAQRMVSVHPLPDYPLVVDILMNRADIDATWHHEAIFTAGFASIAAIASVSLLVLLGRQFRRQAEQNAKLEEAAASLSEGQEVLRAYVDTSADWFWEQDEHLRFQMCSTLPFMLNSNDMNKTRWDLGDPAMSGERWAVHKAELEARRPFRSFRWERIGSDGRRRFLSTSGNPIFDRNGVFKGYRGTGRDVTSEVEASIRLSEANSELELGRQQFAAVLDNITQGICFFDSENRLRLCNRRYIEIYNLPPEALCVGRSIDELMDYRESVGTEPDPACPENLSWRSQTSTPNVAQRIVRLLRNGRYVATYFQPMADGGFVATHEDVTEHHQAEASIAFMAHHDSLTKLPNRVLFRERMEQAIAMASRGTKFAVLCLDLDNFKQINDTLGHPVGDGLLIAVADRLRACVREGDAVGRLGGDEFAIIQLALDEAEDAEVLSGRIMAAFRQPFEVNGHQIMAGTSIGIAVVSALGAEYETLMRDADIALYLAKTEGRGTVRFFEPEMDARIHMRRLLELDLQGAVGRNEFEIYYQPQVNLTSNRVRSFESLLRWRHPTRGFVSPADFIAVAEETGLIAEIGEWVLRQSCIEAQRWPGGISVAVNISPVQFRKGNLVTLVRGALADSGLLPGRLELEITESVFLRDSAETLLALNELRAMGIRVALDDFGTGYSSLSYLRSFPFSKIKIDQSFVRDVTTNKESMSIVRAVIGLGDSLDILTIAEGVETQEQLDKLRAEGCTEVQGYFFSRPVPAHEIPAQIERIQQQASAVS